MNLQLVMATLLLIGLSVIAGMLMRDILFTWHPRAWTARFFSPHTEAGWETDWNDPNLAMDVTWRDPDETWVEKLDAEFDYHTSPGWAWDALHEVARMADTSGPAASPGTALAVREPHRVIQATVAAPAPHSHRRTPPRKPRRNRRGAPAAFAWLDAVDARIADMDRRMGALS
jgi:hypothetical protein